MRWDRCVARGCCCRTERYRFRRRSLIKTPGEGFVERVTRALLADDEGAFLSDRSVDDGESVVLQSLNAFPHGEGRIAVVQGLNRDLSADLAEVCALYV
jgi:hypothetical protein